MGRALQIAIPGICGSGAVGFAKAASTRPMDAATCSAVCPAKRSFRADLRSPMDLCLRSGAEDRRFGGVEAAPSLPKTNGKRLGLRPPPFPCWLSGGKGQCRTRKINDLRLRFLKIQSERPQGMLASFFSAASGFGLLAMFGAKMGPIAATHQPNCA